MTYKEIVDPIVFLQANFILAFMKRHALSLPAFLELDKQKDIIGFLRLGYEAFHLTGEENVLEQMDAYAF